MATVCVSGASGFIALELVSQLLAKGYTVHGTVRSLKNAAKTAPLEALAKEHEGKGTLKLFEADLLQDKSFDKALEGCVGAFHTASPFFFEGVTGENAHEQLIEPALKGTLNFLTSAAAANVKRVILTSSVAALLNTESAPKDHCYTEDDWNVDSRPEHGAFHAYRASKVMAEKAAWEFIKEHPSMSMCTINPPMVVGANRNKVTNKDELNTSSVLVCNYLDGTTTAVAPTGMAFVDVHDVALGHVLAYENTNAEGRFIISGYSGSWQEACEVLKRLYPHINVPTKQADGSTARPVAWTCSTKKAQEVLGMTFVGLEEMLKKTGDSLIKLGLVKAE